MTDTTELRDRLAIVVDAHLLHRNPADLNCREQLLDSLMPTVVQALADAWDDGYSDAQADEFDNNQRPEDRTANPFASSGDTTNGDK